MEKSPEAFRTISEVADWLGVPTHVLRFWESRFAQIKPVKRAGGRRYYRPSDMALIGGIKRLLHDDGMTIRGAQKLLREKGVKHVAALSKPLDGVAAGEDRYGEDVIEATAVEISGTRTEMDAPPTETSPPAPPPETDGPAADGAEADGAEPDGAEPDGPEIDGAEPDGPEIDGPEINLPEIDLPEQAAPELAFDEPAAPEPAPPVTEPVAEAPPEPGRAIPDTPEVPDTDPEDDDTTYPGMPGLAARVRIADRSYLARNPGALGLLKGRFSARASA